MERGREVKRKKIELYIAEEVLEIAEKFARERNKPTEEYLSELLERLLKDIHFARTIGIWLYTLW